MKTIPSPAARVLLRWASLFLAIAGARAAVEIPKVGDFAPVVALKTLDDEAVRVGAPAAKGSVVLVVLRGWPGYQCPICDRQVNEFVAAKAALTAAGAQLVFVYPGPAAELKRHAAEFRTMKGREWPAEFRYALDPDYAFTNAYGLRWDAPRETAYPSTFIVDAKGIVRFAKVSRTHGDRTKAADVVAELGMLSHRGG